MLKTNDKRVRMKIRKWIIDSYNDYCDDFSLRKSNDFNYVARNILSTFLSENRYNNYRYYNSVFNAFHDWCGGLPSIIDTTEYYYYGSAIDFLGDLLEESDIERNRFDELKAEEMIDKLIFRELTSVVSIDELISYGERR